MARVVERTFLVGALSRRGSLVVRGMTCAGEGVLTVNQAGR